MSYFSIDIYGCDAGFARTRVAAALAVLAATQGRRVLLTEQDARSLRLMLPCPLASKDPLLLFDASDIDDSQLLIAVLNKQTSESQERLHELAEQSTCVVRSHGSVPATEVVASQRHKILVAGYDGLLLQEAIALAPQLDDAMLVVTTGTSRTGITKLLAKRAAKELPALGSGALTLPLSSYSSVRTPKLEDPEELWGGLESLLAQMQLPAPKDSGNGRLSGELAASLLPTIGASTDRSSPEVHLPADDLSRALTGKAIKPETQLANLATRVRADSQSVDAKLAQDKQQRQARLQAEVEQWQGAHSQASDRIASYRSQHENLLAQQLQLQQESVRRTAAEQKWAEVVAAGRQLAIEEAQIIDKASTVGVVVEQRLAKLRELDREAARQAEQEATELQRQRELAEQERRKAAELAKQEEKSTAAAEQERRKAAELAKQEEKSTAAAEPERRKAAEQTKQEEKSKTAAELDGDEDEERLRQERIDQVKRKVAKRAEKQRQLEPHKEKDGTATDQASSASPQAMPAPASKPEAQSAAAAAKPQQQQSRRTELTEPKQTTPAQIKHKEPELDPAKQPPRPKAKLKPSPASDSAAAKRPVAASSAPDKREMVRIVNHKAIASHLPVIKITSAIMEAKTHLASSPAVQTDDSSLQAEFHALTAWFHNLAKSVRKKGACKYCYLSAYSIGKQAEEQGQINLANAAYNFSCDALEELAPDDNDAQVIWFLSSIFVVQRSIAKEMLNESSKLLGTMIKNLFRTRNSFADQGHFKLMQAVLTLLSYHSELLAADDRGANDAEAILQMYHTMCESLDPQVSASITEGIDAGNDKVAAQAAAVKDSFGKLAA